MIDEGGCDERVGRGDRGRSDADVAVVVRRVALPAGVRRAEQHHERERQERHHADDAPEVRTSQAGAEGTYH